MITFESNKNISYKKYKDCVVLYISTKDNKFIQLVLPEENIKEIKQAISNFDEDRKDE